MPASARPASSRTSSPPTSKAFVDAINRAKPSGAKGTYLRRVHLASTMGPGIKLDIPTLLG